MKKTGTCIGGIAADRCGENRGLGRCGSIHGTGTRCAHQRRERLSSRIRNFPTET